jgi:predicted O-linked N-acetylglucosamine transferase (SPINDLY family)
MIPNIAHFVWFDQQKEDFPFVYYVAVLSCKVVNNPDKIYMYYHDEPSGQWWKKTKELCEPVFVEVPTHIGSKELKKIAHKSDILRIMKLKEIGGIYLDMDTICVKPYAHLLHNKFVIANETTESGKNMGLCNAIMMTEPNGTFIVDWFNQYEEHFNPDGWQEASMVLPLNLSKRHKPTDVTVLTSDAWLLPSWEKTDMIFEKPNEIPGELIALHYWNEATHDKYLKGIANFDWIVYNSQTLYAKLLLNVLQHAVNVSVPIKTGEPLLPTPVSNKSQDPLVDIFISLSSDRAQQMTILTKINAFCKKLTNKKNSFDIEDFDDFVSVFKMCNSIGLCSILSQFVTICYYLYEDEAHILKHRAYYQKMIKFMIMRVGPIYETINSMNKFVCRNHSYPYAYHDMSNAELFKNIAMLQSKLCPDLLLTNTKTKTNETKTNTNKNKIKVGFVSDFIVRFHSVAKDRIGIIKHLCNDPDFDVKIMTRKTSNAFYEKIMETNASSVIVTMEDGDLIANRKQIADEQFDIIVYPEIGMCMQTRMIAFSRLAPVQITTWGHSDTSGLPNMDYFVSSKFFNTEEDQDHYSEKLVLFDSLGTHYYDIFSHFKDEIKSETKGNGANYATDDASGNDATNVLRKTIIEKTGISNPTLYGCIQIFIKTHPSFISMLNEILKADETGVVVILSTHEGDADDVSFKNYVHARIQRIERVHFIYQVPFLEYIENVKNCDIILDYFPFGGFNSTIESFLLGKVCITRPGKRISGKFTQGLYRKMGITEFICNSETEYVAKAVHYGKNHDERKKYEELIQTNVHKLIQDQESVDEWKTFLKNVHNTVNVQN